MTKSNETYSEHQRMEAARLGTAPWNKWGPYLSERQWGTVREDYSDYGNAWDCWRRSEKAPLRRSTRRQAANR